MAKLMKIRKIITALVLTAVLSIGTVGIANASTCTTVSCRLKSILSSYISGSKTSVQIIQPNKNTQTQNTQNQNTQSQNTQSQNTQNQNTVPQTQATSSQTQLVGLINKERLANGQKTLTLSSDLSAVAQAKAEDMAKKGYFSHTSPTYGSPFDMMKSFGIRYRYAAENIAKNSSVEKAHYALMNSEGHRKNILNGNYTQVGIGIVKTSSVSYIIVEMFIG